MKAKDIAGPLDDLRLFKIALLTKGRARPAECRHNFMERKADTGMLVGITLTMPHLDLFSNPSGIASKLARRFLDQCVFKLADRHLCFLSWHRSARPSSTSLHDPHQADADAGDQDHQHDIDGSHASPPEKEASVLRGVRATRPFLNLSRPRGRGMGWTNRGLCPSIWNP